jgi:hypothetical protein
MCSAVEGATNRDWHEITPFPPKRPSSFHQWVSHIQEGTTATENIQMALDLTRLMEAANRSASSKQVVDLDTLVS